MKVLHVAKYDLKGGAAIAAYNSMRAQRDLGIDARLAVGRKLGDDPFVIGPSSLGDRLSLLRFAGEQIPGRLIGADRYDSRSIGLFGRSLSSLAQGFEPDVVVLHNIDGVLSLREIAQIPQPLIWRMHDRWAISGHRHLAGEYFRPPRRLGWLARWLDSRLRRTKLRLAEKQRVHYCPPSHWLAGEARKVLGSTAQISVVPNGVDTEIFVPQERIAARERLGIQHYGPLLLFGAPSAGANLCKGGDLLVAALADLRAELLARNAKLLVFGGGWPADWAVRFPTIDLGRLSDRDRLCTAYSAADLTIVPSREENLSLTVLESLACGTPVVAFDIGGMSDMIDPGRNGWLIRPFDHRALGERLLETDSFPAMRTAARASILGRFDGASEARGMRDLYERLVPKANRSTL